MAIAQKKNEQAQRIVDLAAQLSQQIWVPQSGPQADAFFSPADELLYGGAAGGGKTDLIIGLALLNHWRSVIYRKEYPNLSGIIDRLCEMVGRKSYNASEKRFSITDGRIIDLGSFPFPGDEAKHYGIARDLVCFDEVCQVPEHVYKTLLTWLRSSKNDQRCRVIATSNPPTSAEQGWVTRRWAPWLDESHPNPAEPGELRWFTTIDGMEQEVASGESFFHDGHQITPISRTFIPSKVSDNRYLASSGYVAQLQALPEPLRSQMLMGDWHAGVQDVERQVIPTEWIKAAVARWRALTDEEKSRIGISSAGLDPSRGGRDSNVLALRYGWHYDELLTSALVRGQDVAAWALDYVGDDAPVHIDLIGFGSSAYDWLHAMVGHRAVAINSVRSADPGSADISGLLGFANLRSQLWWQFRELLSPETATIVALPDDSMLISELASPTYELTSHGIQIESKDQIKKRLGRSTDRADAVIYASMRSPVILGSKPKFVPRPVKLIRSGRSCILKAMESAAV